MNNILISSDLMCVQIIGFHTSYNRLNDNKIVFYI